jgi:hypothetical protein
VCICFIFTMIFLNNLTHTKKLSSKALIIKFLFWKAKYKQRAYYYKRGHSLFSLCKNFPVSAGLRPFAQSCSLLKAYYGNATGA